MIEITLPTTIGGQEHNGGTPTDKGTTIRVKIRTTDESAMTRNRKTDETVIQVKHCRRAA